MFQSIFNTFTMPGGISETIVARKTTELPNEKIKPPTTANNKSRILKIRIEFKGSSLKQERVGFTPRNVVNLFIVYDTPYEI